MTNDLFDPLKQQDATSPIAPTAMADNGAAHPDSPAAFYDPLREAANRLVTPDLSGRTPVSFETPEDPTVVKFGSTSDPMQLDMDPFGRNTVEWGKVNGEALGPSYVKSANIFGKAFTREQLEATEKGRKIIELMEDDRNGHRRSFWDAIKPSAWGPSDVPFIGMFAAVGKSIEDGITVHNALKKMMDGEALTDEEALATRLYMAEQEHMSKGTWGATVGDIVRAAPGFMFEFWGSSKVLGGVRSVVSGMADGSPKAAARLSIDRATKYATRDAVKTGLENALEGATNYGYKKTAAGIVDVAAGTAAEGYKPIIAETKAAAMSEVLPMYEAKFGTSTEMAKKVAAARIEHELGAALAMNAKTGGPAIARWARGTYEAAKDHASRALLDFGNFGTEAYSASGKELGSAMKTLSQAAGILGIEAPIRGGLIMLPQMVGSRYAYEAIYGQKPVTASQLSLEASAVREGNKELMSAAESYALGLNFLEYASENSGAGFGKLFRAAGLKLFGAKAMGAAIEGGTEGLIPRGITEAAGSRMRTWINKAVGTTDDFLRGHIDNKVAAVKHKLGLEITDHSADDAIRTFVSTGNASVLGDMAAAVGDSPSKFIRSAVKEAIANNELDMSYRGFTRYVLADIMARNKWGPQEMTNWLKTAGYDGIVEEMMEERYSDFVKGLFGWDDRASKDKGLVKNIEQAFKNLNPGWEQLTAEAVGFAVPLGVRTAVFQIQKGAGGSDLAYVQNYTGALNEFRGANYVVEAEADTHFRVAEEAIGHLRDQLAKSTDADEKADLQKRIDIAQAQFDKQASVRGAAGYNAEQILAFEAPNTRGDDSVRETPTSDQAKRGVAAKNVLVEGSFKAAEALARSRAGALDPSKMPFAKRAISRVTGFIGGLVTGDLSMAMYDPTAWSMVDRGFNRNVVEQLADAYDKHFASTKARLIAENTKAVEQGTRTDIQPTSDEIRKAMREGCEKETQSIMRSYLAAQGIRIFSAGEMRDQARRVVREKYGVLDGHEGEVEETRQKIAEYTLRLLADGGVQSEDVRRISRGIINLSDENPFADDVILDATMRLSGFQGLEETCELRADTDLQKTLRGRSLSGDLVSRAAGIDLKKVTDDDAKVISDIATRLGYVPRTGANGKFTTAFSKEAIERLNERVVGLCKKAMACANRNIRTYRLDRSVAPELGGGRVAVSPFLKVSVTRAGFTWTDTLEDGTTQKRTVSTEAELQSEMLRKGYVPANTEIVFTPAREIRTKDPAVMLDKLGLTETYLRSSLKASATKEDLVDNPAIHPALRYKRVGDTLRRYTVAEAQEAADRELAEASKYRSVMSMSDADKMEAFKQGNEGVEATLARLAKAELSYKNVFGSEQEKNGYLNKLDKILSAHGVQIPGVANMSYSSLLAGQREFYTLNTRLLNFNEGSAFVLVNLNRDVDYDGALMSRAITNGFMAYRSLWAYDPSTKRYPAFATALRDIVKRLDRVASELAKSSDAEGRRGEADAMRDLADELVGGTNLESPKLDTIVWLARNAVLGQAEREARNSRSTTTHAAASARLAAAVRQTPEFYPFLGLVDICLGGNGFADIKNAEARAEFGVAALARVFSGDEGYSPADLLKNGMLPEKADGTRMSVPEFMDKVNAAIAFINKKGEKVDTEALRQAAESDPMTFVSSLMRSAKLRTPAELKDFMQKVLVAAGISAGYTADLKNWQRDIERSAQLNEQRRQERDLLEHELAQKDAKISALEADANASSAEIQALRQERDDLVEELNALRATQDGGQAADTNPPSPEVPADEPSADPAEFAEAPDLTSFGHEEAVEDDGYDPDWDDDGEGDGMKSYGTAVPDSTVRAQTKDENGNPVGETEPEGPAATMSPEARRHLVWTAMAALSARGMSTAEADVKSVVREMFQCISDEDLDAVFSDFNSFLEMNVKDAAVREDANNAFLALKEYLDDEGKNISDNEGFNDKAVAAYNSLKPFLEMMEAAVPLTKRNFQGLVNVLREEVDEFILEADSAVAETTADLPDRFQDDDLRSAYAMVGALLNPRNISKYVESVETKSVPESLALHSAICKKVLHGDGSIIDAMIAKFLAPVKTEAGITRPENAHLAAFLSFLRSLTNAGTRESLMLLVSSSANCDAVAMDDVYEFTESDDPMSAGTSKRTGDLLIRDSVTTRGSVSVNMAYAAFMPFVGMLPSRIADIGGEFSRITNACVKDLQPMAYAALPEAESAGFGVTSVAGADETKSDRTVLTSAPRTMLLQDLETFRHNAFVIAKALADVFGRDNPLSKMLTSPMLFNSFKSQILRSDDYDHLKRLRTYFNKFAPANGARPEAFGVIGSVIYELSKAKDRATRDSVINTVQLAFTTGNLLEGNVGYPGASARTTDEWYTMLNEFTQAMPDTVVPSKPVPGRSVRDSSVAVAARGPVPIVLRYMTMESDGPMAFRTLCEQIVREDAERDYWIDYGRRTGRYVNPNAELGADFGFRKDEADAKTAALAGLKAFVDNRVENELGGIDAIVGRCIQTMTWPDAAATPIMARNLSVDYSPVELGRACQYSYDGGKNGANADKNKMWYLPLFGGDHACNNLLQIPTRRPMKGGKPLSFVDAAKAVNDEVGITLMLTDTKRSAITSADAPSVPMVGARVEFTDDLIPSVNSARFGECRLHVSLNLASEGIKPDGTKDRPYSQEAMHGMTVCSGVGPDALRRMSKDPKLRIQKFHCIGTGAMLEFEKSASSVVDPGSLGDGGAYPPGTMARAYADHIIKYRGNDRDMSSDTITDEDSYKVGPLKSKVFGIANVAEDGSVVGKPKTLLSFIKERLEAGMKPEAIMEIEVTTAHRRGNVWSADTVEENGEKKVAKVKLSEALDGLEIVEMEGLHPGKRGVDQGFSISYRDNTMLALKVANIAHSARPHVGTNGKNYTIDATTKAIEQMFRNGGKLADDANGAQNQVLTTLNAYAIVSSAVATDAKSVEAALKEDPQLAALVRNNADPDGMEYRKLRAEIVAKRIREAVLSPIQKVDAVLTSCGATIEQDGTILDHSTSQMRRDVHKGSVCFGADDTGDGGLFRGFKRRLALAEVNVKSSTFRYGMFLDDTSANFSKMFDATSEESLMQSMERNLRDIAAADAEYVRLLKERGQDEAFRAWKKEKMLAQKRGRKFDKPEPPESEALTNARTVRNTLRRTFLSCFIDHHGTRMDEKTYATKSGGAAFYWNSMCFEDLFVNPGGNEARFDRTAFYTGRDMIACDIYDFETGVKDEAKSRAKMMFLAGSAFGNPRTPSYNGGMWLQVSRASFPVSEEFDGERFVVGEDALVALDPQTLDIEGCDNDGDESALYMLSPDEHGVCTYGDIETCLPADNPNDSRYANWDHSFASNAALENDDNRRKMLEAAMEPKLGFPYIAKKGDGFVFTKQGQRAVSNQLVQGLIDMAHQLAVPEGTERRNFASTTSGRTKAQPFDDASFWKKQPGEDPTKYAGIVRVMDVMPPDVFANEDDTIGNYRVQEQVSLSAKKSSMARGAIVSAASTLHVAFMSGAFGKRPDGSAKNKFQLFNETDFTPEKWQAFARHFDGLSNATFDDVKERICKRLGLTPEMVDVLVCDLLSMDNIPTTDEEWNKALVNYVKSVRDRTPDGKSVLDATKRECVLTMSTALDAQSDHSRLFIMKVSDQFDDSWAKVLDTTFFKGAKPVSRKETFLSKLGLRINDNGYLTKYAGHETAAGRIAEWFMRIEPEMRGYIVEACSERGYHNDLSGYLLWLTGVACGNLQNVADGRTVDLANVDTTLAKYGPAFVRYAEKRRAWKTAKGFAQAVNYAQADPGAPNARSRTARAEKAYADVMAECWAHLSDDQRKTIIDMRQATKMAYSCGMVNAETPESRAFNALAAVKEDCTADDDLLSAMQARNASCVSDLRDVLGVIKDCNNEVELMSDRDTEGLRNNITSIPYVIAALQCLPKSGFTKDYKTTRAVMTAIADAGFNLPEVRPLGFRRSVESMFSVLYALMSTSVEGLEHPGITYLGGRADRAFSLNGKAAARGANRKVSNYGIGEESLMTIFQTFSARDEGSLNRIREAIGAILQGAFDGKARTHRRDENQRKYAANNAKTFELSLDNLSALEGELRYSKGFAHNMMRKAILDCKRVIIAMAKATNADEKKFSVRPSEFFKQILPVYMSMTAPVAGTPSYEKFSSSILATMPELYGAWSHRQAANDRAFDFMRRKYMTGNDAAFGIVDALSAIKFGAVDVGETALSMRNANVDPSLFRTILRDVRLGGRAAGIMAVRSNPENRTLVDLFAHDGVLFKAASIHDEFSREKAFHEGQTPSVSVANAQDAETPVAEPKPDATLAQLVEGVRRVLGATQGLDVSVEGNTMFIRGQISGDKALKRRNINAPVNTVIRVDLCPSGFGNAQTDLNSMADATSITSALRQAGILDISPRDFLERLTYDERRKIVEKYLPDCAGKSAEGVALRRPQWSIGADGLLTLSGAIKLRKAEDKVLYHEYFHAMIGMMRSLGMFSGGEAAALAKTYGKARGDYELFDEEAAADKFAEFVAGKKAAAKSGVAAFFQKMLDLIRSLLSVMENKGFHYNEDVKTGDAKIAREDILFNMVLSGTVMDSLDSARLVRAQLYANHRAAADVAEAKAMERLDTAVSQTYADRFHEEPDASDASAKGKIGLWSKRMADSIEKGFPPQDAVDKLISLRGGTVTTSAVELGGNTVEEVPTMTDLSSEIANSLGAAVSPGTGIDGNTSAEADRMQQLGHGIAQAIANGLDALDPSVKAILESGSDLSKIHLSQEIYDVVTDGVFSAADALGVDLKAKDQHLKNLVYANMLHLYSDLSNRLGFGGKSKNPINLAREHKGNFVRQKEHVSSADVSAFLLTAGGLSYADIARDTMDRLGEIYANTDNEQLKRCVNHLMVNLTRIVNKTGYKGDPVHEIVAGVKFGKRNVETGRADACVEDVRVTTGTGARNRRMYMFNDPLFQEAINLAAKTAFTLSSAKSLYNILGIVPESLTGKEIPGGRGARVEPVNRRTGEKIQPPLPNSEVVAALGISLEDLLADNRVIDPFAEVGLYLNNPGEWLASTVRDHFGGKALRDMFQEESRKLKGVTDKFRRVQNWWAMYLGENAVENTKLLAVKKDKGHFVFDNGSVSYDETGHERIGFKNYNRRIAGTTRGITVDVTLDREDKEVIDFWLKSAYATAMGDKFMLTGVDGLYFDAKDLTKGAGQRWTYEDFSRDKVKAAYNGSRVGRIKTRAHIMLAQLLSGNQLPDFVVNGDVKLYDRMVKGLVDSMNSVYDAMFESGSGVDPADTNDLVLKSLARKGLVKYVVDRKGRAVRGTVAISADEIDRAFVNSNAYKKLVKAGRDPLMLTREKLHEAVVGARRELDKVVKSSPWMSVGDGRHFNSFGSHMMLFKGSGMFMYWANRIGRDEKKSVAERLNEYESSFVQTLKAEDQPITSAQTSMLADLFGTEETSQSLRDAIRKGEYAQGSRKAERTGLVIEASDLVSSHKVAEIIYRRLNEMAWNADGHRSTVDRVGGRGSVARMIDMYEQLVGERTSWGCMGLSAEQAYQINGELPANYQIFHAMNVQLEDAARTMQFRNTFVNFLFTADEHGMPVSYAKPSLTNAGYADDGIPEQVWEYAARWWAECNGRKYDESVSGRVNAARLYDEIITANKTKTIAGRHFRQLDGDVRQGLTSVSDFAAVDDDAVEDDVNARNALNGGETYGYAKMLFNLKRVVGGKAQSLLMQRIANYSKTLSVQQSAFFPIATKIESSAAAVGFWTMVSSNFTPKLARKMDKAIAGFDKVFKTNFGDTMNRNFIGFKDIIEMMDTDDPFLADAINLCDDLGISLSDRLVNPYESDKAIVQADMMKIVELVKRSSGDKAAAGVKSMLDGFLFRGSERAFSYALNATKIATVLQLAQKVRRKCHDSGRAFDFANEMRPYAAYLNAEIGGIDPLRYAWADPRFRRMMNATMFSWEWTKGAWAAGGGEIFEEAFGGGHFTNPETRAHMMGRWLRMYGTIMIGVPLVMQAFCLAVAKLFGYAGDDDDKWFTWENEEKHNLSAFDITPLLRALAKSELVLGAKEIPVLGHLVPAYTGKDKYNTTGKRRYYMHFGKQGWEFFRWFTSPEKQFLSKLSMPLQRMMEGLLGYNMASREYDLPFSKMSFAERWLNPTLDGAWWNLAKAYVPFSWNAMSSYGDAGAISILGPVSMGTSYMASIKDAQARLTAWAKNDRSGYSFGYPNAKNKKRLTWLVSDILADAKKNGMDPQTILTEATGLAAKALYSQLYDALPKEENADVDVREIARAARGLRRLNVVQKQLFQSMKSKLERHGKPWKDMTPIEKAQFRAAVKAAMMNPYTADERVYRAYLQDEEARAGTLGVQQASKGGAALSNFLATDKVPETLFGFPVVKDNYEERDLAFFKAYPEAGGYYDMEDGSGDTEPPETPPPTGGANKGGKTFVTGLPKSATDFSTSFEAKADRVVKDGKAYYRPTKDAAGKYDIGGYRSYWSAKRGKLVEHSNAGLVPEAAYLDGKRRTDEYVAATTNRAYSTYGVDPAKLGEGLKTVTQDIVFNTGGNDFVRKSPKFTNIVSRLKASGLTPEESYGMALALEQDSYGYLNNRRMAARGGAVMDELAKSENPTVVKFVDAYRRGYESGASGTPAQNELAYGTNWAMHSAGMREAAKVADELGLDYTGRDK